MPTDPSKFSGLLDQMGILSPSDKADLRYSQQIKQLQLQQQLRQQSIEVGKMGTSFGFPAYLMDRAFNGGSAPLNVPTPPPIEDTSGAEQVMAQTMGGQAQAPSTPQAAPASLPPDPTDSSVPQQSPVVPSAGGAPPTPPPTVQGPSGSYSQRLFAAAQQFLRSGDTFRAQQAYAAALTAQQQEAAQAKEQVEQQKAQGDIQAQKDRHLEMTKPTSLGDAGVPGHPDQKQANYVQLNPDTGKYEIKPVGGPIATSSGSGELTLSELTPKGLDLLAYKFLNNDPIQMGMSGPVRAKVASRAAQLADQMGMDPQQASIYLHEKQASLKGSSDTIAAFNSASPNSPGAKVTSLSTAVEHLRSFKPIAASLGNGDTQALNKAGNFWSEQTGKAVPATFEAVRDVVSDEIVNSIIPSRSALADRAALKESLKRSLSPEQFGSTVDEYTRLMSGRLLALKQQYEAGIKAGYGTVPDNLAFDNKLLPNARKALQENQTDYVPEFKSKDDFDVAAKAGLLDDTPIVKIGGKSFKLDISKSK